MRQRGILFVLLLLVVVSFTFADEWDEDWGCPSNSHWNGVECRCDDGYATTGDSCITLNAYCLRQDSNSHYNAGTETCDCNTHYAPVDGSCMHGSTFCNLHNADYNPAIEDCECRDGYEERNNNCEPIAVECLANEHVDSGGNCVCNTGYERYSPGIGCEPIACSANAHYDSGEDDCVCDTGYELVSGDCVEPVVEEPVDEPEEEPEEEIPEEDPVDKPVADPVEEEEPAVDEELADEPVTEPVADPVKEEPADEPKAVVEEESSEPVDEPEEEAEKESFIKKILPKKDEIPEEPEMKDVKPPEEKKEVIKELEKYDESDFVKVPVPLQKHALKLAEEKEPAEIQDAYEATKTVSKLQEKNGVDSETSIIPLTIAQEFAAKSKKDMKKEDKDKFEIASALLNAQKGVDTYEEDAGTLSKKFSDLLKDKETIKKEKEIYKKQKEFLENDANLIKNTGNALYFSETKTREYEEKLKKIKEVKDNAEFRILFEGAKNKKVDDLKNILKYKKRLERISESDTTFGKNAKAILEKANEMQQYATDKAWFEETLKASGHGDKAKNLKREELLQKLDDDGVNVIKEVGNHIVNNEIDGNVKLLYDTYNNAQTNKEQFTGGPQAEMATKMQLMVDLGGVGYGATTGAMGATTGGAMAVYGMAAKKMVEATAKIDQDALKKLNDAKVGVDLRKSHPINTFLDKHGDEKKEDGAKVTTLKFKDPRTGKMVEEKLVRGATAFVTNPGTGMLLPANPDTLQITGKYQYKFVKGTPLCPWCDDDHIEVYTLDGKKVEEEFTI